jgi:hypothetical protein
MEHHSVWSGNYQMFRMKVLPLFHGWRVTLSVIIIVFILHYKTNKSAASVRSPCSHTLAQTQSLDTHSFVIERPKHLWGWAISRQRGKSLRHQKVNTHVLFSTFDGNQNCHTGDHVEHTGTFSSVSLPTLGMTCPQRRLDKEYRSVNLHPLVDQPGQKNQRYNPTQYEWRKTVK